MALDSRKLPVIATGKAAVLPGMTVNIDLSGQQWLRGIETAVSRDQKVFLITVPGPDHVPDDADLYRIGTIARVRHVGKVDKQTIRVTVEGLQRASMIELVREDEHLEALAEACAPDRYAAQGPELEAMLRALHDLVREYLAERPVPWNGVPGLVLEISDPVLLVNEVAAKAPFPMKDRQELLDAVSMEERYDKLCFILVRETQALRIRRGIQRRAQERIEKNQKEYVLREQLKVILEELGERTPLSEAQEFRERLAKLTCSEEVRTGIGKEIDRFRGLGGNTAETSVQRTYLETLLDLPWDKMGPDTADLPRARRILDEDHYGLEKVKERVLEYLAVRMLTGGGDSPILCLVGPPGTGKTSIARSLARATERTFVRISLGGVRDEAEIRGHRRTYVGAMPGRIVDGLRKAGQKNPVMLLDEIDKMSSDYRGETSNALLEVLDQEQNSRFRDHYIEFPVDLSHVMFIATANNLENIPRPLADRMEIIEIGSYTENEKLHIAREHLFARQTARHGLSGAQLSITRAAFVRMISGYTREAGVRQLERCIGKICRRAARMILEDGASSVKVGVADLPDFLGREKRRQPEKSTAGETGIACGLAWTPAGGEILRIEAGSMPGRGELILTGRLGDVMKESARAAISWIRGSGSAAQLPEDYFAARDIHVHVPEGAVPKDGPSAGITMTTAIYSAVTGRPVRADVAMTGEITLRGRVLAIGGLKEKLLAAGNAGIRTVIVPEANRPDVEEMPAEITGRLDIHYVSRMEQVLALALEPGDAEEKA